MSQKTSFLNFKFPQQSFRPLVYPYSKVAIFKAEALAITHNDKTVFVTEDVLLRLALKYDFIVWELDRFYAILDYGVVYIAMKPSGEEEVTDEDYSY